MVIFSIIIPHFNSTDSLNKLIGTIPNAKEIEIIIIDDHSDPSEKRELLKLKERYSFKNVTFLNNTPDKKGAGACRNIGLMQASGEWVLFADSDDYFLEDFYKIIQKYSSSGLDVVFLKPTSIEFDSGEVSDRHLPYVKLIDHYKINPDINSEIRLRYFYHVPWSKLINKRFIKKYNIYFDEVIASNDVMFSTKVGYHMENFEVSDEKIYCVTRSEGSLTTTISPKVFKTRLDVFICYYRFLKEFALNKDEFKLIKLNVSGRYTLLNSFNFGYKQSVLVYKKLRENKIHIIDREYFNPIFLIKKAYSFYISRRKKKKYIKLYQ
ncbi:glycosyltransferase [Virgibacillus oceani]